jgi:hypothetical protein
MVDNTYFSIEELVPESIFLERGQASIELLDARALPMLNSVRIVLGSPMVINNWVWGGVYRQSGLRTREFFGSDAAYIKSLSQHKYGRGFDNKLSALTVREAAILIIKNHKYCPIVSFIEIDRPWLHTDCRINRNGEPLVLWSPDRGYVTIDKYLNE